jgi:hypothetical protein
MYHGQVINQSPSDGRLLFKFGYDPPVTKGSSTVTGTSRRVRRQIIAVARRRRRRRRLGAQSSIAVVRFVSKKIAPEYIRDLGGVGGA